MGASGAWEIGALHGGGADLPRRLHGHQVLPPQPGLVTATAQVGDAEGFAGDERERQRGAQHLAAALALGAIDLDRRCHDLTSGRCARSQPFTQTTCRKVWTISTRSACACMTASMGL